jgi:hypothetical protein
MGGPVAIDPAEALEYAWLPVLGARKLAFASMDRAVRAASISLFPGV